ncbi:hypothetical protein RchiOBHm_Chr7g0223391 [Rosa chinensis]|uniref:Uncharacterized protein n=1 Tax=Rosa chinensis TaxID=74649 RepID=A0A2P6PDK5_ROSCH|nr:hypothetical protein RchiOBHm_Chr7g0223391 [Rosa chinensis]
MQELVKVMEMVNHGRVFFSWLFCVIKVKWQQLKDIHLILYVKG